MPGKILRRCTICKKFHASYLVEDPELAKCYLCYTCWKARSSTTIEQQPGQADKEMGVKQAEPKKEMK